MFVLRLDDLPAIVKAAESTSEVWPLGFVTLGTGDDRDRGELPVRCTSAPRLRTRGLPLGVGHDLPFDEDGARATRVAPVAARGTETATVVGAQQRDRERGVDELPYQVDHVEQLAAEDVVVPQRRVALGGVELLVHVEVQRALNVLEAAVARPVPDGVDRAVDANAAAKGGDLEHDARRLRKAVRSELGDVHLDIQGKGLTGRQDGADIDVLRESHSNRGPPGEGLAPIATPSIDTAVPSVKHSSFYGRIGLAAGLATARSGVIAGAQRSATLGGSS